MLKINGEVVTNDEKRLAEAYQMLVTTQVEPLAVHPNSVIAEVLHYQDLLILTAKSSKG